MRALDTYLFVLEIVDPCNEAVKPPEIDAVTNDIVDVMRNFQPAAVSSRQQMGGFPYFVRSSHSRVGGSASSSSSFRLFVTVFNVFGEVLVPAAVSAASYIFRMQFAHLEREVADLVALAEGKR